MQGHAIIVFVVGQNLALGQQGWQAVMDSWYNEIKDFAYGSNANQFSKIGHFTQVLLN